MPNTASPISLTPDQQVAVNALLAFIQDPNPPSPFFAFAGYAGTGKTFCMREVVARCKNSHAQFAYTAPTNKAAKELRKITGEASTIYSLLGLRIDKSGELKTITTGKPPTELSNLDVIFLDEGWMCNKHLFAILEDVCDKNDLKVVFMGDRAQLPPVGESASPVDSLPHGANLTQVVRHGGPILELVTEIRLQVHSPLPCITLKSKNDGQTGVWKLTKPSFRESIYNAAASGGFADGDMAKVIAWRNKTVDEYNALIRSAIFGAAAVPGYYLLGDRIVATGPCTRGDETLLTTDDEAIVEGAMECQHPLEPKYQAIELKCRAESGALIRLLVMHPNSAAKFKADSETLAHDARGNGKLWRKFWDHQDLFHPVKYAYALTTHRAQGSTYTNVWVDTGDILINRNRTEAFQCLYTACSRPTQRLTLA
jgi:hypothetical protein